MVAFRLREQHPTNYAYRLAVYHRTGKMTNHNFDLLGSAMTAANMYAAQQQVSKVEVLAVLAVLSRDSGLADAAT